MPEKKVLVAGPMIIKAFGLLSELMSDIKLMRKLRNYVDNVS